MSKEKNKTATAGFKFKIIAKGNEPLTIHEMDLKQVCWDCIFELERRNQQNLKRLNERELLDLLLQSYYTLKMVYSECSKEETNEMKNIEDFVIKLQRRMFELMQMEELKNSFPAFQI